MPKTYTVKEVADILGFSTNSIYTFLKEKRIKGVRVGKGRFRIPDEELSRILHLSKKPQIALAPVASSEMAQGSTTVEIEPAGDAALFIPKSTDDGRDSAILMPNIFDWFVGLAAVVTGIGLFLFNASVHPLVGTKIALFYPVVRTILIACGFGVIISGIVDRNKVWRKLFYFTLAAVGFVSAYGLAMQSDIEGALLFGGLAFVGLLAQILPFGGIVSILMYASLIAIFIPASMVIPVPSENMFILAKYLGVSAVMLGVVMFALAAGVIYGFWVGYAGKRSVFVIATFFAALCDVALAVWFAHTQIWSRAFFMLVIANFTALLPYWWPLPQKVARRYKFTLHGMFAVIGVMLVMAIIVVYVNQTSQWDARERVFTNKIHLAQRTLESTLNSVQSSLSVAANSGEFVTAISKKDIPGIVQNAKIIYQSNPNIRRLVFLDKDGEGIALYPYGTFDEPNFSYREYFQEVKTTGKPYISDVFQARADNMGRYVVAISVPLFDEKGKFIGVMSGSLDLERIGLILSQIAADTQGEYFIVTDTKGVILLHPDAARIGTVIDAADPIHRAFRGEIGVVTGSGINHALGMVAYAEVPSLHWAMSLRASSQSILGLVPVSIWGVFGAVCFILITGIILFSVMRGRIIPQKEGGT